MSTPLALLWLGFSAVPPSRVEKVRDVFRAPGAAWLPIPEGGAYDEPGKAYFHYPTEASLALGSGSPVVSTICARVAPEKR